jgi:hypothetical protein
MSMTYAPVIRARTPRTVRAAKAEVKKSRIKNIALFMIAPVVGLVYAMLFPLFALGTLAWMACKALIENGTARAALRAAKKLGMLAAAPVLGLLFVATFPLAGLAALAWTGMREPAPVAIRR